MHLAWKKVLRKLPKHFFILFFWKPYCSLHNLILIIRNVMWKVFYEFVLGFYVNYVNSFFKNIFLEAILIARIVYVEGFYDFLLG